MYIRTRDEALDALAETLQFPDRRSQIVDLTVKIILCLHPDPRQLLCDGQAALVEGGLEEMARKRRDLMASEEVIVIINPEEERFYDAIGRALDAARVAAVVAEVFPVLAQQYEAWEIARTVLAHEEAVRACLVDTVRARNTVGEVDVRAAGQKKMAAWLEQARPAWRPRVEPLRTACRILCGEGPQQTELFMVVAADDERAARALDLIEQSPSDALEYLAKAREVMQTIRRLEEESGRNDSDSQRRVA